MRIVHSANFLSTLGPLRRRAYPTRRHLHFAGRRRPRAQSCPSLARGLEDAVRRHGRAGRADSRAGGAEMMSLPSRRPTRTGGRTSTSPPKSRHPEREEDGHGRSRTSTRCVPSDFAVGRAHPAARTLPFPSAHQQPDDEGAPAEPAPSRSPPRPLRSPRWTTRPSPRA